MIYLQGREQAMNAWALLYSKTRLKNNERKLQFFGRTLDGYVQMIHHQLPAKTTAHILGASLGVVPRSCAAEEDKRAKKVFHHASKAVSYSSSFSQTEDHGCYCHHDQ